MASSRPSDHLDAGGIDPDDAAAAAHITQPRLGFVGYLRTFWRQLTSMRTAIFLLLLLAFAAVPGSLVPQNSSDPNGVLQYKDQNPGLAEVLGKLQLFDTYTSVWFSAIYLLLFVSLVGCVLPRTRHHLKALRSAPPRTPARLERLAGFVRTDGVSVGAAAGHPDAGAPAGSTRGLADAEPVIAAAQKLLARQGYRTRVFENDGTWSVSAERGYLRETGNLVFHGALVGILIAVGVGGGFSYTGQRIIVEGQTFSNVLASYDSFTPGRFFNDSDLVPYRISLDKFTPKYEENNIKAYGQAIDFTADVTTRLPGASEPAKSTIKVNSPLGIGGTDVFLLGNGFAPVLTIRDAAGTPVFSQPVVFRPQDANLTSVGVVKVPDGLPKQVGMLGFFYPTVCNADLCPEGSAKTSVHPDLRDPELTLEVYTGDLGLDEGVPRNVYSLDTSKMTQVAGRKADTAGITLKVGDTAQLPDGLGSIELTGVKRFIAMDIHHDPTQLWVLGFAILVLAGLLTGLFIPRRRVWVKAVSDGDGMHVEYAGLARGEDPGLAAAVSEIARRHSQQHGLRLLP